MRCGCSSPTSCQCAVVGGSGIAVSGAGSGADPFVIDFALDPSTDNMASATTDGLLVPGAAVISSGFTVDQNGAITLGATSFSEYSKLGKWVVWAATLNITSVGSSGTAVRIAHSMPAPLRAAVLPSVGDFLFSNNAGTTLHKGSVIATGSSSLLLLAHGGAVTGLGVSPALALGVGDFIRMFGLYKAA